MCLWLGDLARLIDLLIEFTFKDALFVIAIYLVAARLGTIEARDDLVEVPAMLLNVDIRTRNTQFSLHRHAAWWQRGLIRAIAFVFAVTGHRRCGSSPPAQCVVQCRCRRAPVRYVRRISQTHEL